MTRYATWRTKPIHRRWHHDDITFGLLYAFSEKFVMPLSHDEVVHGKGSLYARMPGDDWQKRASLRALYALMWTLPGKKLLFMGSEFAQHREWSHDRAARLGPDRRCGPSGVVDLVRDLISSIGASPRCTQPTHAAKVSNGWSPTIATTGYSFFCGEARARRVR